MNLHRRLNVIVLSVLLLTGSASCAAAPKGPLALASFTENFVTVSIALERDVNGAAILAATFTPEKGHHLYSKDIPIDGLMGLGRPTLLELTEESQMTALGDLVESVPAQEPDFDPKELLVYPTGPVSLKLPVQLPLGSDWIDDEVRITYMACTAYQCKPPVEGRIVLVHIPGEKMFDSHRSMEANR
ncbi:MAG TPA: hypothetical protein VHP14_00690 [Anaerolineales bacterium]|nr:hypothetical protein [Anaerolineales bacterium]